MDEEFGEDLEVVSAIFDDLVPHVHDEHVIVVVDEPLTDLVQLREEFKALVIDQITEDERLFLGWLVVRL